MHSCLSLCPASRVLPLRAPCMGMGALRTRMETAPPCRPPTASVGVATSTFGTTRNMTTCHSKSPSPSHGEVCPNRSLPTGSSMSPIQSSTQMLTMWLVSWSMRTSRDCLGARDWCSRWWRVCFMPPAIWMRWYRWRGTTLPRPLVEPSPPPHEMERKKTTVSRC